MKGICQDQGSEESRGAQPRFWEGVKVGEPLTPIKTHIILLDFQKPRKELPDIRKEAKEINCTFTFGKELKALKKTDEQLRDDLTQGIDLFRNQFNGIANIKIENVWIKRGNPLTGAEGERLRYHVEKAKRGFFTSKRRR